MAVCITLLPCVLISWHPNELHLFQIFGLIHLMFSNF
jgi:hypothetical protein